MRAVELADHLAPQLHALGWTPRGSGVDGALAWSRWTKLDDGEWHGTLTVVEEPGGGRRSLRWRFEEVDRGETAH